MSQSITNARRFSPEWMDRENALLRRFDPGALHAAADPSVRLMKKRRDNLGQRLGALKARGRVPRVGLYDLTVNGQTLERSLREVRAFAMDANWQVGAHPFLDPVDALLQARPDWLLLQRQMKAGLVDGVVMLTQSVISPDNGAYERELDRIAWLFGFIAVVFPKTLVSGGWRGHPREGGR